MTVTPEDRETPGLHTWYYAAPHGVTVSTHTDGVFLTITSLSQKKKIGLKVNH